MNERTIQVRQKLVLMPERDGQGDLSNVTMSSWYDGWVATEGERMVELIFSVPADFFDPVRIEGDLKSRVNQVFTEFFEEVENAN